MNITQDRLGFHLHFSHQHFFLTILLVFILVAAPVIAGGWYLYRNFFYDSSTSRAELADLNPPTPAPEFVSKIHELKSRPKLSPGFIVNPTATRSTPIRMPILMYHYVEYVADKNDKIRISLNTTPATLDSQISTLKNAHYTFLTGSDLADILDGQKPLPEKPILLTFDDGYRDFYTDAYPILKKYQAKATNYVISGFLDRRNHLLKSQLTEITRDGLVEIGAHTVHHLALAKQSANLISTEVFQSKVQLETIIGKPVVSFAYPFGSFDVQAIGIVKSAGFRTAVSTLPGVTAGQDNRYYLFRLRPGARTGPALLDYLSLPTYNQF